MAIYSTFFACEPSQLSGGFPGWKLPFPMPIQRSVRNPFTGEMTTVSTTEPDWSEDEPLEEMEFEAVGIAGDYEDYLERRIPAFVRANPHWCAKGLTNVELEPLLEIMGWTGDLQFPLYAPPSRSAAMFALPPILQATLADVDDKGCQELADRWAEAMSTPDHTHSVSGERLNDGWASADALSLLRELRALARAARTPHLFLLLEW